MQNGDAKDTRPLFDPFDRTRVKHSKVGVWDFYQEIKPRFQASDVFIFDYMKRLRLGLPHLWTLLKDISRMPGCRILLIIYLALSLISSFIPAMSLWYSSQILTLIQSAIETHKFDRDVLFKSVFGGLFCAVARQALELIQQRVKLPLEKRILSHFTWLKMEARLHLDCPSFEDDAVQRQFDSVQGWKIGWRSFTSIISTVTIATETITRSVVLYALLRQQPAMLLYAALHGLPSFLMSSHYYGNLNDTTWAATAKENTDYLTMTGIGLMARNKENRKELVAGNLQHYLSQKWFEVMLKFGGLPDDFHTAYGVEKGERFKPFNLLLSMANPCSELTLLYQAINMPSSLPASYASLALIRQAVSEVSSQIRMLQNTALSLTEELGNIRQLYSLPDLPKAIEDGKTPFPENAADLASGISVEFRNVSFQYPRTESHALQDVSFKIEQGQLCVIVGSNGSGKSTLLKLLLRLYDPTEGVILINGQDIKSLRMIDLRNTISVLFQDYSIFPLSIKQNIGLGDPIHANDDHRIEQAAELAGATEVINKLPRKFDTYTDCPVHDSFSRLPEGTYSLFGSKNIKTYGNYGYSRETHELSGGESQRLALARSFMRYLADDEKVSMLVFDEPSASLDPEAEYNMFERLRKLRGSKTMIFSSHRFGNLTRHADLILYMKDSKVVEHGNHSSLLKLGGGYASMYKIQADAFRGDDQ